MALFSGRKSFPRPEEPFAARLERARASGLPLLDLTETEPARCGLGWDVGELDVLLAAQGGRASDPADELARARDAVASYLGGRGASVSPDRVHLAASRPAAQRAVLELVCDPGDEVLAPSPGDPLAGEVAAAASVSLGRYAISYDGAWRLDRRTLQKAVTRRTRAVLVGNPAEPTGAMLSADDVAFLEELCLAHGLALVGDESFADTARDACPCVLDATRCLSFHVSGLSGVCGLPGVGAEWWAVAGPDALVARALSRLRPTPSADAPSRAATRAIPALLARRGPFLAKLRARLAGSRAALAVASVREAPWSLLWGGGGCWAVLEIGAAERDEALCSALLDEGVVLHPGSLYGFPPSGHLVLSLRPPPEVFGEALGRLDGRLRSPLGR